MKKVKCLSCGFLTEKEKFHLHPCKQIELKMTDATQEQQGAMTDEERVVWIGERILSDRKVWERRQAQTDGDILCWLSSPIGLADIKQAMIERGYSMYLDYNVENKEWCCDFFFPKKHQGKHGKTEAEAVLQAAYKALSSEGV